MHVMCVVLTFLLWIVSVVLLVLLLNTVRVEAVAPQPAASCATPGTCLDCICGVYSNNGNQGCGKVAADGRCGTGGGGCKKVGGECRCGVYGVTSGMYSVCKTGPFKIWQSRFKKCSAATNCAVKCVMNYISENGATCVGKTDIATMTCDEQARIYKGGATGCNSVEAQQFADTVRQCCGKIY